MKVRFVIYFKHFVLQRFFLKIVLRFVSLNVRGLRVKRKALFLFFKKPHCGMLQKSHCHWIIWVIVGNLYGYNNASQIKNHNLILER